MCDLATNELAPDTINLVLFYRVPAAESKGYQKHICCFLITLPSHSRLPPVPSQSAHVLLPPFLSHVVLTYAFPSPFPCPFRSIADRRQRSCALLSPDRGLLCHMSAFAVCQMHRTRMYEVAVSLNACSTISFAYVMSGLNAEKLDSL